MKPGAIIGILLAAGSSTRFGAPKLLHPLADGTPMVVAALRNLAAGVDEVIVVVRPDNQALIKLLSKEKAHIVPCADAKLGMGDSLSCGIRAAHEAEAWLIALADMPYVPVAAVTALAAQLRAGASIVAPTYQGQRGHPVGFNRAFYRELACLSGDQGARHLLDEYNKQLSLTAVADPGILRDIDTPADL